MTKSKQVPAEPQRVTSIEARQQLTELLNLAQYGGQRTVIERHGKPVAAIIGIADLEVLTGTPQAA